jgi:hypothetical protein
MSTNEAGGRCGWRRSRRRIPIRATPVRKQPGAVTWTGGVSHRAAGRGSGDGITAQYWKPLWSSLERYLETDLSKSGRAGKMSSIRRERRPIVDGVHPRKTLATRNAWRSGGPHRARYVARADSGALRAMRVPTHLRVNSVCRRRRNHATTKTPD